MRIRLLTVSVLLLLAGCAAPTTQRVLVSPDQEISEAQRQQDLFLADYLSDRERLQRIYWRIATQAVHLCTRTTRGTGIDVTSAPKGELMSAFQRAGISERPTIVSVAPGSPADRAGVRTRDTLVSVLDVPAEQTDVIRDRLREGHGVVSVVVERHGEKHAFVLDAQRSCDYPPVLIPDRTLNAFADGNLTYVTRGMMEFARTDDELALVLGHEMAHNTMRHADARRANAAAGLAGDLLLAVLTRGAYRSSAISDTAAQSYSQEFEAEADYVGLYMLASSGFSTADAPRFWRRMASANPGTIRGTHTASHPPTSYRMVALEEAAKEIDRKRQSGAPLTPERKDGRQFVAGAGLLPSPATSAVPGAAASSNPGTSSATSAASVSPAAASARAQPAPAKPVTFVESIECVPNDTRDGSIVNLPGYGNVRVVKVHPANTHCGGVMAGSINRVTATVVVPMAVGPNRSGEVSTAGSATSRSAIDRLRELKTMRDENLITQEQFESRQRAILAEH